MEKAFFFTFVNDEGQVARALVPSENQDEAEFIFTMDFGARPFCITAI
jgi:hypothetical protein